MKRNNLIKLLTEYEPSINEADAKPKMLEFVQANPNCFERELAIGHITGSAWLLNREGDKALLMHHLKLNKWLQPGGHADGETDILSVAIKEAREESGINAIEPVMKNIFDLDIHEIPSNAKNKAHFHYDVRFLLQVTSDERLVLNEEAHELKWFGKNKANLPTQEDSVTRMFDKWMGLEGKNLGLKLLAL